MRRRVKIVAQKEGSFQIRRRNEKLTASTNVDAVSLQPF